MSYGLPVVTTDAIPGAGEILQQGEIGLISPNKNPQALAKNIARLYNDTALRQTLIDKGSRRIGDFHPDVIGKQINDYLQEIVDS
jgi:glycosyltransferase involved in cell wall biosynthesis